MVIRWLLDARATLGPVRGGVNMGKHRNPGFGKINFPFIAWRGGGGAIFVGGIALT